MSANHTLAISRSRDLLSSRVLGSIVVWEASGVSIMMFFTRCHTSDLFVGNVVLQPTGRYNGELVLTRGVPPEI